MNIELLLEREIMPADNSKIGNYLEGKTILITGAAGSVGSELANRLNFFSPKKVLLLDYAESALYELEWHIKRYFPALNFEILLANIVEKSQLIKIFDQHRPDIIFHTAAYKQVPILEKYPDQAILTNLSGTKNIADLSLEYGVEKMIFISTDKAVNPVSVMGASKKLAENYILSLIQQAYDDEQLSKLSNKKNNFFTQFIITRFGNVLGSSGSVLPLFLKQIDADGPLTVTHPEMTRYFMSISEAAQFVLEAGNMGSGGEIYWFNISKPVGILNFAKKLINLSGKEIKIVFTGLRPGEKIHEEWMEKEDVKIINHQPYLIALQENYIGDPQSVDKNVNELILFAQTQNTAAIKASIKDMLVEKEVV